MSQNERQGARDKESLFGSIANHVTCNSFKKCIRVIINGAMYYLSQVWRTCCKRLKETYCFGNLSHYSNHGVQIGFKQKEKNIHIMKRRGRFDFQILVWNETLKPPLHHDMLWLCTQLVI